MILIALQLSHYTLLVMVGQERTVNEFSVGNLIASLIICNQIFCNIQIIVLFLGQRRWPKKDLLLMQL